MEEQADFIEKLETALTARREWIESAVLPQLKEDMRGFQTAFASLYMLFLKKGLVNDDPYKQELKMGDLSVPDSSSFSEAERAEQLGVRLSGFDNQLDFLVNFYQLDMDFLNPERIKLIAGLVQYIDWTNLGLDSANVMTKAVANLVNHMKAAVNPMALRIIGESQSRLNQLTGPIMEKLRVLSQYFRESYKLRLRKEVFSLLSPDEAQQIQTVKKMFTKMMDSEPFYGELVEEVMYEDFSRNSETYHEKTLAALAPVILTPRETKAPPPLKLLLLEAMQALGTLVSVFNAILPKIEMNKALLASRRLSLLERLKRFFRFGLRSGADETIYELEFIDPKEGKPVTERLDLDHFTAEVAHKVRTLTNINARGAAFKKLESMQEDQLLQFLDRYIREIQGYQRTFLGLDEYFKFQVSRSDREKVRGIRPELATVKNALVRATQKRFEYASKAGGEMQFGQFNGETERGDDIV
jgi:hypothetical protein